MNVDYVCIFGLFMLIVFLLTNFNSAFATLSSEHILANLILPSLNVGIHYNLVNMEQVIARKGTPKQFMFIVTRQSSRAVTFLATV